MAGKSDTFEYQLQRLIYNGVASTGWSATAGTTTLWVGAFTADPGEAGSTANEGGYTAYTRVATDRSSVATTGWAITSGTSAAVASASPVATLSFPQVATTSTGTFTYAAVYTSSAIGTTGMLHFGTLTPNINFSQNVTPQITTGSSITEE